MTKRYACVEKNEAPVRRCKYTATWYSAPTPFSNTQRFTTGRRAGRTSGYGMSTEFGSCRLDSAGHALRDGYVLLWSGEMSSSRSRSAEHLNCHQRSKGRGADTSCIPELLSSCTSTSRSLSNSACLGMWRCYYERA